MRDFGISTAGVFQVMLSSELLALGRPRMKRPIRLHQEQNGSWFVAILNDPNFGFWTWIGRFEAGSRVMDGFWLRFWPGEVVRQPRWCDGFLHVT